MFFLLYQRIKATRKIVLFNEQVLEMIGRLVVENIERELSVVFELEERELVQTRGQIQVAS